ncbi:MAG TPA: hypothetical protein VMI73_24515 [Trebonia sp.]|nr:hypothetical protein [Trebonia sp.]
MVYYYRGVISQRWIHASYNSGHRRGDLADGLGRFDLRDGLASHDLRADSWQRIRLDASDLMRNIRSEPDQELRAFLRHPHELASPGFDRERLAELLFQLINEAR